MKIYIAHPTAIDYQNELYAPLKADDFFSKHDLVLPHETTKEISNIRDDYRNMDCVIAERSVPSLGVGIELGGVMMMTFRYTSFTKMEVNLATQLVRSRTKQSNMTTRLIL